MTEMKPDSFSRYVRDAARRKHSNGHVQNHDNNADAAMDKYFNTVEQGGLPSLKAHLRNSQAKWDEAAFGGAMYGADDSTIPSTSTPAHTASMGNKADRGWYQHSILTMLQATRITPTAMLIAELPRARLLERASLPPRPRPAMRPYRVSIRDVIGVLDRLLANHATCIRRKVLTSDRH